jgi:DNA-directed RNA polymerase subunit RPC12/RpoP
MLRCPVCGSTRIDQDMMMYGPMNCLDCGFRVEDKNARPNPFVVADDDPPPPPAAQPPPGLGEQLAAWKATKRRRKT